MRENANSHIEVTMRNRALKWIFVGCCLVDSVLSACPKDYENYGKEGVCLKVFGDKKRSWLDSVFKCSREGGSLLEVRSHQKHQFVKELLLREATLPKVWETDFWLNLATFGPGGELVWMSDHQTTTQGFENFDRKDNPKRSTNKGSLLQAAVMRGTDLTWHKSSPKHLAFAICQMDELGGVGKSASRRRRRQVNENFLKDGKPLVSRPIIYFIFEFLENWTRNPKIFF